jgi:hypothetical protein
VEDQGIPAPDKPLYVNILDRNTTIIGPPYSQIHADIDR